MSLASSMGFFHSLSESMGAADIPAPRRLTDRGKASWALSGYGRVVLYRIFSILADSIASLLTLVQAAELLQIVTRIASHNRRVHIKSGCRIYGLPPALWLVNRLGDVPAGCIILVGWLGRAKILTKITYSAHFVSRMSVSAKLMRRCCPEGETGLDRDETCGIHGYFKKDGRMKWEVRMAMPLPESHPHGSRQPAFMCRYSSWMGAAVNRPQSASQWAIQGISVSLAMPDAVGGRDPCLTADLSRL